MAAPRRRTLTEADRATWAAYATQVAALHGPPRPEVATPAAEVAMAVPDSHTLQYAQPVPSAAQPPRPSSVRPPSLEVGTHPGGIDSGTWSRFRTGKLPVARTLDLHGRTAQRAYAALGAFLRTAHADRVRCVEVITGRGSGTEGGVIRRELPLWLNLPELRPLVLAASHPHPANPGSVRVLLRRVRA